MAGRAPGGQREKIGSSEVVGGSEIDALGIHGDTEGAHQQTHRDGQRDDSAAEEPKMLDLNTQTIRSTFPDILTSMA